MWTKTLYFCSLRFKYCPREGWKILKFLSLKMLGVVMKWNRVAAKFCINSFNLSSRYLLISAHFLWISWKNQKNFKSSHQKCSIKKVFLQILQNSQENTCARVSFLIKLLVWVLQLIKKETLAQVFLCEFCQIFKNNFFTEHRVTASETYRLTLKR